VQRRTEIGILAKIANMTLHEIEHEGSGGSRQQIGEIRSQESGPNSKEVRLMLNGGLWRVWFSSVRKLSILERETGVEHSDVQLGKLGNVLFSVI
jgi:hypothetical protein